MSLLGVPRAHRTRRAIGRGRRLRGGGLLACAAVLALPGAAAARTLEHKLVPTSGEPGFTGFAADIDGDTAVVGAPLAGDGSGAVYVFERAGAGWTQTATLTASDPQGLEYLGFSVAIDGDTIVAGRARQRDRSRWCRHGARLHVRAHGRRAAHRDGDAERLGWRAQGDARLLGRDRRRHHHRRRAGLSERLELHRQGRRATPSRERGPRHAPRRRSSRSPPAPANDLLGWSVAIDGDTIVAGAPTISEFFAGGSDNAVYTFARSGAPTRNETARLTVTGGGAETSLGVSVAIDGDVIAAGAPFAPPTVGALAAPAGAVYTFARAGAPARTETATLSGSGGSTFGVYLGGGVDIDGDSIVAGAVDTDASFAIPTGAAYRFSRTGASARTELERLHLPTGIYNFGFFYGSAVASSGGTIIVGAPSGTNGSEAAYVSGPETTITSGPEDGSFTADTTPSFTFESDVDSPTFECRIGSGDWGSCTSPREIGPLSDDEHTFAVRATDQYGDTDPSPATRTFTVDTTPPDTSITAGPPEGSFTTDTTPAFEFSADEAATFECQVDSGDWAPCTSPSERGPLADAEHTFRVRAIDRAGTVDPSPATRTFVVNRPPVAVADAYSAIGGASLTVPAPGVLANDSDADGQTLTADLVSAPAGGGLTLHPNGSLTYAVPDDVVGAVTFTYRAFDGFEYSNVVAVTITVRAGCDGVAATVTGTPGNDVIGGTGGNDVITALGGNDTITPGSGVDRVCGGAGADTIDTGSGNDVARGGSGIDTIDGGSGDDALYGGDGDDRIDGGGDRDRLFGEAGLDRLFGGGDPDVLDGGADTPDRCDGEGGSDSTTGGCEALTSVP